MSFSRPMLIAIVLFVVIARGIVAAPKMPAPPQSLRNFEKVDDYLYRGAQPSAAGMRELAKMGVKTIIDLRGEGGRSSIESDVVKGLGMQYVHVPLDGYQAPTTQQISKLLALLQDQKNGPIFIHCRRGADRTGTVIALYRITHDHWGNQKALGEAMSMKMAKSEKLMRKLILDYKLPPPPAPPAP